MITFDQVEIVKKYLGKPYKHLGRGVDGLDCWGLIINIYKDHGFQLFDLQDYEKEWARRGQDLITKHYYEKWQKVTCPQIGDVILFNIPKGVVGHAGLMLNNNRFIQATRNGVVVSHLRQWSEHVHGFYRYFELG